MIVKYDKSFEKSLEKLKDKVLLDRIEALILKLENSNSLSNISGAKKLSGYKTYYRIRVGDYRVGLETIEGGVMLIVVANRKDIYGIFP